MIRGILSMAVLSAALLAIVVLAGCEKYVPYEVKIAKPEPPAECFAKIEKIAKMKPIPRDPEQRAALCGDEPLSVCATKLWAKHDLVRAGIERRAEQRRQVCEAFLQKL